MHDPQVVAFEIRRPWPKRSGSHDARYQWATWLKPWNGWMAFWTVAGKGFYFPSLITVWHVEPNGQDALTVCRTRSQRPDGTWKFSKGWIWHVHHWKIQISPLQRLRRSLLTKCEKCGRKGSPNTSHHWDGERVPWWRGEKGLYHGECSSLVSLLQQKKTDESLLLALASGSGTGHLPFHARYRLDKLLDASKQTVE